MTLLGTQDHADASYVEIAQAITDYGSRVRREMEQDLEQLFRRVVFNVMTAHRDDHLRPWVSGHGKRLAAVARV